MYYEGDKGSVKGLSMCFDCYNCIFNYTDICVIFVFFFFSSRRRHTRCGRDWSSDVCSSDLVNPPLFVFVVLSAATAFKSSKYVLLKKWLFRIILATLLLKRTIALKIFAIR